MITQYTRYALKALLYVARRPRSTRYRLRKSPRMRTYRASFSETILVDLQAPRFADQHARQARRATGSPVPPNRSCSARSSASLKVRWCCLRAMATSMSTTDQEELALRQVIDDVEAQVTAMLGAVSLTDAMKRGEIAPDVTTEAG